MRRMAETSTVVLLVLLTGACQGSSELPTVPVNAIRVPDGQVATLLNSSWSGVSEPRRSVIRSADEWTAFWAEAHASLSPNPPAPAVDFAHNTVIALAMGGRASGGYGIRVKDVFESADGLHVVVEEISPGPLCMVTTALTNPVFAVVVSRVVSDVTFIEEQAVQECR